MKAGVLGLGDEVMNPVTKLMEGSDYVEVPQQAGFVRRGFVESTDEGRHGVVPCPILLSEALEESV